MSMPWFYEPHAQAGLFALSEASCKHAVQVLRMRTGDALMLTNGLGKTFAATLTEAGKKNAYAQVNEPQTHERALSRKVGMAVSPLKNTSRFEWFLEKASELGVADIFPIQCQRTIPGHFRLDRMQGICTSAMLQSQQAWLPVLHEPKPMATILTLLQPGVQPHYQHGWLAHCEPGDKHLLAQAVQPHMPDALMLIGPEGDFTPHEISLAIGAGFQPVSLGPNRLRTETAALTAATLLCLL